MGTMKRQLSEIGMLDALPQVIEEAGRVRGELGYPIMVTPFSQFVGSQALMNVLAERSGQERYSRIPDEVLKFVLGHFGTPEGPILPEVLQRVADMPRSKELSVPVVEKSLEELHTEYATKFGRALTEEELMLRLVLPAEQLDGMLASGPAPAWKAGSRASRANASGTNPVTNVATFIAAANTLPDWKYLAVNFAGQSISLQRSTTGDSQ
jgi:oxaloacetate decarboxylase alpha subunit